MTIAIGVAGLIIALSHPFGEATDWRHRFSTEMFSVARIQLAVETKLKAARAVEPARLTLGRGSFADGYLLRDGALVLVGADNRFVLIFEPVLDTKGNVSWTCQASPESLFARLGPVLSQETCGASYRDAFR